MQITSDTTNLVIKSLYVIVFKYQGASSSRLLHSRDLFYFPSLNVQSDGYYYSYRFQLVMAL